MKDVIIIIVSSIAFILLIIFLSTQVKAQEQAQGYSCALTFYAKTTDAKTWHLFADTDGKYYKTDVTLTQDGVIENNAMAEITKLEFDNFCKNKFNPPYSWYTEPPRETTGH